MDTLDCEHHNTISSDGRTTVTRYEADERSIDTLGQACSEMCEVASRYMRKKPHVAAYVCVAIGFVLGWKLRP